MDFPGWLEHQWNELKSIELQLTNAPPKLSLAAACGKLEALFALHVEETEGQIDRLDKISKRRGQEISAGSDLAMAAMIAAAPQIAAQDEPSLQRDAGAVRKTSG